jgi:hypothetical protein
MMVITLVLDGMNAWFHGFAHSAMVVLTGAGHDARGWLSGDSGGSVPKVTTTTPPAEFQKKIQNLLGIAQWFAYGACVLGVIVFGGRMALAWQNGNDARIGQFALILLGAVLIAGATSIIKSVV